ncbi:DUF7033 domain-containing protein [Pedobacter nototheniae]|uniref:DUF7033 domain-containing protein n=1 Tax=Pedobacter nototheniae TaxID=2488994 RepID=UPI00292F24E1|nr:hypothetical protein [Pedobacter nototheniae]
MHLIIFSSTLTPRIKYIFNFIFKDILKAEVEFTGNSQYFSQSDHAKISYGDQPLGDELFFKSTGLLFSNKVEDFTLKTTTFGDYEVPFPVEGSALPFDVFAASFFLVSRFEEYLHHKKSAEDFKPSKSYQHKWKLLDKPIIDGWALILKNMIRKKYPAFKFHDKSFSHHPTINFKILPTAPDGFLLKTKFFFQAIFKKETEYFNSRFDKATGLSANHDLLITEVEKYFESKKNHPIYFIEFPNVPIEFIQKDKISKYLDDKAVGLLRPCANESQKAISIKDTILKLKKLYPAKVNLMSQQLEVLEFPTCYLKLLNSGITSDYSMGYANTPGFRAGTCTAFNWYDLQLEKVTPLNIKPYCITDTALEHLPAKEALTLVEEYVAIVRFVDGTFYSSWQLKSLSNNLKVKKLKNLFKEMLKHAGN